MAADAIVLLAGQAEILLFMGGNFNGGQKGQDINPAAFFRVTPATGVFQIAGMDG